jgi:hypothetical protein
MTTADTQEGHLWTQNKVENNGHMIKHPFNIKTKYNSLTAIQLCHYQSW